MQFVSFTFLIFFAILLLALALCREERQRQIVLLAASWLFYAWWDWRFPILLLIEILTAWITGRILVQNPARKKAVLTVGIAVCLSMLIVCKYCNFFIESFCLAFGIGNPGTLNILLPVGISFYTLQSLSYMIDIYRGKVSGTLPLWSAALYIGFFPQIMSGPIVKAHDFLPQLGQDHKLKWKNIEEGAQIFLLGVVKKYVIADTLAVCVDAVYEAPAAYSWVSILIAVCAYSFQIYCDFSGYSDMAIGIARAIGYDLGRNFNAPYLAANPSEFWQRWHISLSSWFKEYVYFPLGGSRKGHARTLINLLIVMLLSGLWHGAAWNYLMWGALHGICSIIHKLYADYRRRHSACKTAASSSSSAAIRHATAIVINFAVMSLCQVSFRAESVSNALVVYKGLFTLQAGMNYIYIYAFIYILICAAAHVYTAVVHHGNAHYLFLDYSKFRSWLILWLVLLLTLVFFYVGGSAFVYLQF